MVRCFQRIDFMDGVALEATTQEIVQGRQAETHRISHGSRRRQMGKASP